MTDDIAAAEIAKQIAALRPHLEGPRGVMAYLEKPAGDVNKTFLATTIRGVNAHNRRQEEEKCWKLRRMEQTLDDSRDRRRSRRRSRSRERKRRRSQSRSRSRSRGRERERNSSTRLSRDRGLDTKADVKQEGEDERSFWARKKAEKTRKLWENLHAEGTVSVENAPDFSAEESDDEDAKPPARKEKKHKKHKKLKSERKKQRRRSRS